MKNNLIFSVFFLWVLLNLLNPSLFVAKDIPYHTVRICNHNNITAALYLKVQYRKDSGFYWNLVEVFPQNDCVSDVEVIPKVEYAVSIANEFVERTESEELKYLIQSVNFTTEQTEYHIEDISAHQMSLDGMLNSSIDHSAINTTTTPVKYMKSVHPEIHARTLKHHERSKKIRISLINLLEYNVSLTRRNLDSDRYTFIMKLKMLEEAELITDIGDELGVFTIPEDRSVYPENVLDFIVDANRPRLYMIGIMDELEAIDYKLRRSLTDRYQFLGDYQRRSGGSVHYVGHYSTEDSKPRDKVQLFTWPAKYIGQIHNITLKEEYWQCPTPSSCSLTVKPPAGTNELSLQLEAISTAPKIFLAQHFLTAVECQELIRIATPLLGLEEDPDEQAMRTSSVAWLSRADFPLVDSIVRRAADLLNVSDSSLYPEANAEHLQVVRYEEGEAYAEHYDWSPEMPGTRHVTLLLYLNDFSNKTDPKKRPIDTLIAATTVNADGSSTLLIEDNTDDEEDDEDGDDGRLHEGGETAFFRANNGKGLAIHPGQGSAVLFYNLLEDGNGDELTLHASLPVKRGVKWLANLWVWDPSVPLKDLQNAAVTEEGAGQEEGTVSDTNETGATD